MKDGEEKVAPLFLHSTFVLTVKDAIRFLGQKYDPVQLRLFYSYSYVVYEYTP